MNRDLIIDSLISEDGIIYIAGRLFDIEEKIKSELLENAIIKGVNDAFDKNGLKTPERQLTFVPFRDASQEELKARNKTELLYNGDIKRLNNTSLFVTYIDGLAKDEGVCFEIGYAYANQCPILLISTDFFSHYLPSGIELPLDPLIYFSAHKVIRYPNIFLNDNSFYESLIYARQEVLNRVSNEVLRTLLSEKESIKSNRAFIDLDQKKTNIFVDFGGEMFEWQEKFADELSILEKNSSKFKIIRPHRYKKNSHDFNKDLLPSILAKTDIKNMLSAQVVLICSDAEECHSGSSFLFGMAKALGRETWIYNSKKTKITGPGGYKSSRNLMLDYSADKTFTSFDDLKDYIKLLG